MNGALILAVPLSPAVSARNSPSIIICPCVIPGTSSVAMNPGGVALLSDPWLIVLIESAPLIRAFKLTNPGRILGRRLLPFSCGILLLLTLLHSINESGLAIDSVQSSVGIAPDLGQ